MKQSDTKVLNNRRSFLKNGALAAGAATMGTGFLTRGLSTFAQATGESKGPLTAGDAAILRFAAAAN
jgi:nitrous oxide reductase